MVEDLKVKELLAFFQAIYPNSLSNQEIDDLLQFTDKKKNQLAKASCLVDKAPLLFCTKSDWPS